MNTLFLIFCIIVVLVIGLEIVKYQSTLEVLYTTPPVILALLAGILLVDWPTGPANLGISIVYVHILACLLLYFGAGRRLLAIPKGTGTNEKSTLFIILACASLELYIGLQALILGFPC